MPAGLLPPQILDGLADAIVLTSVEGEIQYVNPAFELMTGWRREEVLGKNPRVLSSGKHDAEFYAAIWQTLKAGKVWRGQIQNRRKDGAVFTQETTISPVCDDAGTTVSYVGLGRDVTVEVKRAADLRQSQKMETIGRLAGGIAHDFNNLLSVIIAYSDVVLEELQESHPLREDVKNIREAGDRAAGLTRQLLAFSRKQVLQPAVLDLNGVVEGMAGLVRRLVGENIEVKTLLAPDLGRVRADPAQLEQVIMNLAANARDAMPAGGKLTIETANAELDETYTSSHVAVKPGRYVMLSVSDTGVGMDESTMSQVFEPFFTTKPVGHGTGLGMATVYGIVKQSGGSIWAYSEPGRGSTFKIYLPRIEEPLDEVGEKRIEPDNPRGSETILVVEDDEVVRKLTCQALRRYGYQVIEAANGNEALLACEKHRETIPLMITDVVMPQIS